MGIKNVNKYKEITLGIEAIEYIKHRLSISYTLAQYILDYIVLENGYVTVGLPPEANMEMINKVDSGGLLPTPPESEWKKGITEDGRESVWIPVYPFNTYAVKTIQTFLRRNTQRLCFFENFSASPEYPFVQRYKTKIILFEKEVYHMLGGGKHENDEIEKFIKESKTFPSSVGILTSLPDDCKDILSWKTITSDMLRVLVDRTEKIVVGAYDGEAYIVWNKAS
jgi:hypothetical protein